MGHCSDVEQARALLQQAAETVSLGPGLEKPTELAGNVKIFGLTTGTAEGSWKLIVASDQRSHTSVSFPGYNGDMWAKGKLRFLKQNFDITPLAIERFLRIFNLRGILRGAADSEKFKIHKETKHGAALQCVKAFAKDGYELLDVCLDSSLTPQNLEMENIRWTFGDYRRVGDRQFPVEVIVTDHDREQTRANLDSIHEAADAALDPPSDLQPEAGPECTTGVTEGHLTKRVTPVYPQQAKMLGQRGTVILGAIIGKNGKISKLAVLESVSPMLDQSALTAVRQWEYTPYSCDGKPVEVNTTITVNFQL